jgi:hypothetical protein
MISDDELLSRRALAEIGRLNRELHALHEEEERCKLRRSRLEAQKAAVQHFFDQHQLARRLAAQSDDPARPIVHIERHCGVGILRVEAPKEPPQQAVTARATLERRKIKPDGLPTIAAMILVALRETGKASRPAEITEFVRKRWWAEAPIKTITTTAWQMADAGKLLHHDGRYGLNTVGTNGAGHNGAGH